MTKQTVLLIFLLGFFLAFTSVSAIAEVSRANTSMRAFRTCQLARKARSYLKRPTFERQRKTSLIRFATGFRKACSKTRLPDLSTTSEIYFLSFKREQLATLFDQLGIKQANIKLEKSWIDESSLRLKHALQGQLSGKYSVQGSAIELFEELEQQNLLRIGQDPEILPARFIPSDPAFYQDQSCSDQSTGSQLGLECLSNLEEIKAPQAWDIITDTPNTVIAIMDDGLTPFAEDLVNNLWVNPGEDLNQNGEVDDSDLDGIDNDQNGFSDDLYGVDLLANIGMNEKYLYGPFHGAHVAGIVAAEANNSKGIAGVVWKSNLLDLTVMRGNEFNFQDLSSLTTLSRALQYAIAMKRLYHSSNGQKGANIRVVNISLLAYVDCLNPSAENQDAVDSFVDVATEAGLNGILLVVAAGNEANNLNQGGLDEDGLPRRTVPAACDIPNMITVAATSPQENNLEQELAPFSNYGPDFIEIAVPGVDIYSVSSGYFEANAYTIYSGTSMATPHVTGAVALAAELNPNLSPFELKELVLNSSSSLSSLAGLVENGRFLDLEQTVKNAVASSSLFASEPVIQQNSSNPFDVNNDNQVSPVDALLVINALEDRPVSFTGEYLDVNGDWNIAPIDALLVINELES